MSVKFCIFSVDPSLWKKCFSIDPWWKSLALVGPLIYWYNAEHLFTILPLLLREYYVCASKNIRWFFSICVSLGGQSYTVLVFWTGRRSPFWSEALINIKKLNYLIAYINNQNINSNKIFQAKTKSRLYNLYSRAWMDSISFFLLAFDAIEISEKFFYFVMRRGQ